MITCSIRKLEMHNSLNHWYYAFKETFYAVATTAYAVDAA